MKFDIKHKITGDVIFTAEIDCDSSTEYSLKIGLAVKVAVSLNANLHNADLHNADLRHADLRHADLRHADLRHANLSYADLAGANLRHANLSYADLSYADLWGTIGNMREVKSMQIDTYSIVFTACGVMQIGCKRYSIEEWKNFNDAEISEMDIGALEWWKKWKEFIFTAIEKSSV